MTRRTARLRRRPGRTRIATNEGFALVEIMAASVILIVIVVALTNLLMDSLTTVVLSRQREAAISLASDTIENAKALGQNALTAAATATGVCSALSLPLQTAAPVLTCQTFAQGYKVSQANTTFTVSPTIAVGGSTGVPDTVTVTVTWAAGAHSYVTSTQVGT